MTFRLITAFALMLSAATPLLAQIEEGDRLWLQRAKGAEGSRASFEPIDAVINAYGAFLHEHPENLEARWKLMRALRFKGAYVARQREQKRVIFDQARQVGEAGFAQLNAVLAAKKAGTLLKGNPDDLAAVLRDIPHAAAFLHWDAVAWGEWAQVYGKLAAARRGAADRILREATLTLMIDPAVEQGGGARILGRLHDLTPRIPFITGWASDRKAVDFLRASLASGPENKLTKLFLAEALVSNGKSGRPEAIKLLSEVIQAAVDPAHTVEDLEAQEQARALLSRWGA